MLDDPSETTQVNQANTRLFLPGPLTSPMGKTIAGTPMSSTGTSGGAQKVRLSLALVWLSLVAILALVLGVLFAVLPLLSQPKHNPSTQVSTHIPSVSTRTQSTEVVPQTPVQGTTNINGLSILPTHFTVQSDCQPDNGYRCTATLYAAQSIDNNIQWQASSEGVITKFSPPSGKIEQGQQQQVIIYIYNPCPYSGTLLFAVGDDKLTVPVSC